MEIVILGFWTKLINQYEKKRSFERGKKIPILFVLDGINILSCINNVETSVVYVYLFGKGCLLVLMADSLFFFLIRKIRMKFDLNCLIDATIIRKC